MANDNDWNNAPSRRCECVGAPRCAAAVQDALCARAAADDLRERLTKVAAILSEPFAARDPIWDVQVNRMEIIIVRALAACGDVPRPKATNQEDDR